MIFFTGGGGLENVQSVRTVPLRVNAAALAVA